MAEVAMVLLSKADLSGYLLKCTPDRRGNERYFVKHDDDQSGWERIDAMSFRMMRDKGAREVRV